MTTSTASKTRGVSAADLVSKAAGAYKPAATSAYWLGILPRREVGGVIVKAPCVNTTIGAGTFSIETRSFDDTNGRRESSKHVGAIQYLTKAEVEDIAEKVSRSYLRWKNRKAARPHAWFMVGPTEGDMAEYAKLGRAHEFQPTDADDPAAHWLFMVKTDNFGSRPPEPMSVTGIEF